MTFEIPKETYKGSVMDVALGDGPKSFKIGGENAPAFHLFEGEWPTPPKFALEVYDLEPEDWPEAVREHFRDVLSRPLEWARKCTESYGAEAICLQLASTDPIEKNTSPEEAAYLAKEVSDGIDVPLIVYGTGTVDKDTQVLTKVAEACAGKTLFLGPAVKENLEAIGDAAKEYGHGVIIQTALEMPLAKGLNQKLTKMLPADRILFDPLSPGLGYGMEYGYSIMERVKLAGIAFGDANLQMPLVANIGKECWDTKEAKESKDQGLIWETMTGLSYLMAGANLMILRNPISLRILKKIVRGE